MYRKENIPIHRQTQYLNMYTIYSRMSVYAQTEKKAHGKIFSKIHTNRVHMERFSS